MRFLLMAVIAGLILGCSNPWKRADVTASQADRDLADCKRQTKGFTDIDLTPMFNEIPLVGVVVTVLDVAVSQYRESDCMSLLGYRNDDQSSQTSEVKKDVSIIIGAGVQPKFTTVKIYTEKSAYSNLVEIISNSDSTYISMRVVAIDNDWVQVATSSGKTGWAKLDSVKNR
jgi:hypothetical protein